MGHKEINIRRVIPAPPGAVFALLLDRSTWPTWSGHDTFELVRPGTAGPYEVGSVGLLRSGRRVMREEIVEVVADQRVGYTLLAGLPLRGYRAGFELTPTAEGPRSAGTQPSTHRPGSAGSTSRPCTASPDGCSTDSASDSAIAPPPGVDPLPALVLVWTTTAAGLALFRVGYHPWPPRKPPQQPAWCSTWPAACRGHGDTGGGGSRAGVDGPTPPASRPPFARIPPGMPRRRGGRRGSTHPPPPTSANSTTEADMTETVFLVLLAGHLLGDWVTPERLAGSQQDPLLGCLGRPRQPLPPDHGHPAPDPGAT
jgi:uncharacterized protein YndB with AHSA1/START domain